MERLNFAEACERIEEQEKHISMLDNELTDMSVELTKLFRKIEKLENRRCGCSDERLV